MIDQRLINRKTICEWNGLFMGPIYIYIFPIIKITNINYFYSDTINPDWCNRVLSLDRKERKIEDYHWPRSISLVRSNFANTLVILNCLSVFSNISE